MEYMCSSPVESAPASESASASECVIVMCACERGGVSNLSRHLARPPSSDMMRRWTESAFRPSAELDVLSHGASALPKGLLSELKAAVLSTSPDDDIVRQGGSGTVPVHLLQTNYPSTRRTRMSACRNGLLNFYPSQVVMPGKCQLLAWHGCCSLHSAS